MNAYKLAVVAYFATTATEKESLNDIEEGTARKFRAVPHKTDAII